MLKMNWILIFKTSCEKDLDLTQQQIKVVKDSFEAYINSYQQMCSDSRDALKYLNM